MKFSKLLCSGLFTFCTLAGNIGAPIALPSAKVLPKGVRNLSIKGVIAQGTDKYTGTGEVSVLAEPFFQSMSFSNSIAGEVDPVKRGEIEAAMIKAGANPEDSFGDIAGQVNLTANVTVPVFAIGLTEKITAAIAIPVIKTSLNLDTAVFHNNSALFNTVTSQLALAPGKREELIAKLNNPVDEKLKEFGYKELESEEETKLGDIKLVGKYKAFENKLNAIVVGAEVTLPTGRKEDIDKAVDLPGGDGQFDLGVTVNYDYNVNSWLTLSTGASHTVQFADTTERRIPFYRNSKLSPYKDPNTKRDLGDISLVQLASKVAFNGWNLGVGYSFQYKDKDVYTGNQFDSTWYEFAGKDTVQNMHNATATLAYDTIGLFKAKKFPIPLSVSLTHSQSFAGKNVVKDPLTVIDFALFF
jgi:hypothetical protein